MSGAETKTPTKGRPAGSGAGLPTLAGLAAAFRLASCCALPLRRCHAMAPTAHATGRAHHHPRRPGLRRWPAMAGCTYA
jgi:hypothetical protein